MPYAVIEEGGKQYRVEEGDSILIERRAEQPGSEIQFDRVLLYHDGSALQVGKPLLEGVLVRGSVKSTAKGPKLVAYKFRRRNNRSHTKIGHRQQLLSVQITGISASS